MCAPLKGRAGSVQPRLHASRGVTGPLAAFRGRAAEAFARTGDGAGAPRLAWSRGWTLPRARDPFYPP